MAGMEKDERQAPQNFAFSKIFRLRKIQETKSSYAKFLARSLKAKMEKEIHQQKNLC